MHGTEIMKLTHHLYKTHHARTHKRCDWGQINLNMLIIGRNQAKEAENEINNS